MATKRWWATVGDECVGGSESTVVCPRCPLDGRETVEPLKGSNCGVWAMGGEGEARW